MIAQTRLPAHAPAESSSMPSTDLLHKPSIHQALNNLLAIQMQLELATSVPVAIYGPAGQTLPGISPIKPRLSEQQAPLIKDLLAPQRWPQQNGQMLEVIAASKLHYFITPFVWRGAPIAQIILGPLQLFEPGAPGGCADHIEPAGKIISIVGVPVLASWKAQAAAEIARTLISKVSLPDDAAVSHLPAPAAPSDLLPERNPQALALIPSGSTPPCQQSIAVQLGALAHDAMLPEKITPKQLQKAIESTAMIHTSPEQQDTAPLWSGRRTRPLADNDYDAEKPHGLVRLLRHLVEAMPQAVIVCAAPDGHIVLANQAARSLWPQWLGRPAVENEDSGPLRYHITLEDYPAAWLGLRIALRQAEAFRSEVSVERDESDARKPRPMLLSAFPLQTAQEPPDYAVAIFEDLSGLVDRELFKDELLLLAAHDIRNPLTLISSHAQLMERTLTVDLPPGQPLARARGRRSAIPEQVAQLTQLTSQLSTVTRLQSAQQRPASETINLARLVQRAAIDQHMLTPERTIETLVERDTCLVQAEEKQLHLILMSLLKNAVRYSHPSKPISIALRCTPANDAQWAEVSVRDQGIGIPRASLTHIFERFYRVVGSEQRARAAGIRPPADETASMGLGLYLCKQLIERMGGHIWAESGEGPGATLRFALPLQS